ncbi:glycosyltransferase [Limosilactobacillus pontis]|uniref:Glycosyltransferase n=1 Tax=Limosilactobacillus pontis TaxID=35787 RepID=A0ABU7SU41_9LACO
MRILFVNTVPFGRNGISTFIINNVLYLSNTSGDSVSLAISNHTTTSLKKEMTSGNIHVCVLPSRKRSTFSYLISLVKLIKKTKFDVVYIHGNSTSMVLELFAAFLGGCKIRVTHSHNTQTEHPLLNKFLRPFFELLVTDRLACSNKAGQWLYGDKKFITIFNGINVKKYSPNISVREKIRASYNISSDDILLGNVGGLNYQKNQNFLVDLVEQLDDRYRLFLIGDGPNYKQLYEKIRKRSLENRIFLIGEVSDVESYLSAIDVFAMPSRYEGFPFSLIEAQASGLVCLASDRITTDSNLTRSVYFKKLEIDKWVKFLKSNSQRFDFNDRIMNVNRNQILIRKEGYDAQKNGEYLADTLHSMIAK